MNYAKIEDATQNGFGRSTLFTFRQFSGSHFRHIVRCEWWKYKIVRCRLMSVAVTHSQSEDLSVGTRHCQTKSVESIDANSSGWNESKRSTAPRNKSATGKHWNRIEPIKQKLPHTISMRSRSHAPLVFSISLHTDGNWQYSHSQPESKAQKEEQKKKESHKRRQ